MLWSPARLFDRRTHSPENLSSVVQKEFCNTIRCKADIDQALPMDFMITPRKRISDAVDDAARRPTAPRAPTVLDPIAAIAQSCAMSEVAAETAAEQGIRATCRRRQCCLMPKLTRGQAMKADRSPKGRTRCPAESVTRTCQPKLSSTRALSTATAGLIRIVTTLCPFLMREWRMSWSLTKHNPYRDSNC